MKPESELFILHGNSVGISVFDFFKWWSGDMLTNSVRGVLAEYIVAMALGCEEGTRLGAWNEFDLVGPDGIRVEVKSSAYMITIRDAIWTVSSDVPMFMSSAYLSARIAGKQDCLIWINGAST